MVSLQSRKKGAVPVQESWRGGWGARGCGEGKRDTDPGVLISGQIIRLGGKKAKSLV